MKEKEKLGYTNVVRKIIVTLVLNRLFAKNLHQYQGRILLVVKVEINIRVQFRACF